MLNLIKMDIYRLFHSRAVKLGAVVAAAVAFLAMLLNLGILEIIKFGMKDNLTSVEEMAIVFPIVSWLYGVDFADVIFTGTNAFALFISCIIVSSFVGAEQSCGYVKNIAGQLPNRGMTIVSKFIVTCLVQLIILLIYTIVSSICATLFFRSYINAHSIGVLIEGLLLRFLLFCAINAVVLFFCTLTKSHAIAMVVGAIFGIGATNIAYLGASGLLSVLKIDLNVAHIMPDGINSLISVSSLGEIAVKAIVVSVVVIAGFLTGAVLLFKNRDVK